MSALLERERLARIAHVTRERGLIPAGRLRPRRRRRGGATLDELISTAWAALGAPAPIACLVCGGQLIPDAAPATPPALSGDPHPGGTCVDCGSRLD